MENLGMHQETPTTAKLGCELGIDSTSFQFNKQLLYTHILSGNYMLMFSGDLKQEIVKASLVLLSFILNP